MFNMFWGPIPLPVSFNRICGNEYRAVAECDKRKTSRLAKLGEAMLSIVCKLLCRPIIPFLEDINLKTLVRRSKLVRVE